jgi:transcriptional regulator with XRE-family HTH domain
MGASRDSRFGGAGGTTRPTLEQCVGRAIESARTQRGKTRQELSVAAGIDEAAIGRYEQGERWSEPLHLVAIATALEIRIQSLFADEQHPT